MRLIRCESAETFRERARDFLLEAEPENNLIIGIAADAAKSESDATDNYWAVVEADGVVVGAAFRTPPWPPGLALMPDAATELIARDLHSHSADIPGVNGAQGTACRFAEIWQELANVSWRIRMSQRIHVLEQVIAPMRLPEGSLRAMTRDDLRLVRIWFDGFARDADLAFLPAGQAERVIDSGYGRIWDDAGPKCMVAATRETPNGRTVNAVYTPPESRRRGYATAAVAEFSREILASGKRFCSLYTDAGNPTSNSIYRRIGYRPIRDDVEIVFER